jgi:hypothetical protein
MENLQNQPYQAAYDKAMRYFAEGADEKYISLQLAEQGVSDEGDRGSGKKG